MKDTIALLRKCAVQFAHYAKQHEEKALRLSEAGDGIGSHDSRLKARVNLKMCELIEDHIGKAEDAAHEAQSVIQSDNWRGDNRPIMPEDLQ